MLELIRNKLKRKNKVQETLETLKKHWELQYNELESRHEALKDQRSAWHEQKNIRECECESLKREMQKLRSALDEKMKENILLRDNLASLNSLIAKREAEKEIISAQLREAESVRESYDVLSATMLEETLLREEEMKTKFEKALRLRDVSIAVMKERHAFETQRLTITKKKAVSDLTDALSDIEEPEDINTAEEIAGKSSVMNVIHSDY